MSQKRVCGSTKRAKDEEKGSIVQRNGKNEAQKEEE